MAIEIHQEKHDDVCILALSGRLDTETAADVELALQDLLAAGEKRFLVDLSGIGYVSSAGLRVLLALAKKLGGAKDSLRLCGLNASVKQVFDVAGFSKLFAILPDRDAALGAQSAARPETLIAQHAARLLGAVPSQADADPRTEALARAAAAVLGLSASQRPGANAASVSMRGVPAVNAPARAAEGLLGKLRGWFGGKR